jgi:type I restriction enzyme, S subunit
LKWNSELLGELVRRSDGLLQTGPFGSQLHESDYVEDGVGVVMPKDIVAGRIDASSVARVGDETADRLKRHRLREGAVLMPRRGDITKHALVSDAHVGWLCGTGCLQVWIGGIYVLPEYLGYYLDLEEVGRWLEQNAVGTTMLNLSAKIVSKLPIRYPHRNEQRAIVHVLKSYDDLVANNQRRVTLLEEAARQLYREWFVRLRFPGAEHTRIVDGVPEGWERTTLGTMLSSLEDGDWVESKDQGGEDFRLLQVSNIGVNDFVETGNFRFIDDDTFRRLNCREVLPGQLLISRMPEPIGRAWLVREMPWRMVTAVDVAIAEPDTSKVEPLYLVQALNAPEHFAHCAQRAIGATRARIPRRILAEVPLVLPSIRLQQLYAEHVAPMASQRAVLERMNTKLRIARDLLLPRLMSGQLTV